jgi:PIN domain nuclease of toxin-antitoxin system
MTMPHRLGKRTQRLLKNSTEIHYSSISSAELAIKQMIGKLRLEQPVHRLLPGQKFREQLITSDRKMLELGFDWILDSYQ